MRGKPKMKPNIQKLYSKIKKTRIILAISLILLGLISSQIILATTAQASSQYDLTVNKAVRNLTSGQGYFSKNINASNNDRLMFQIQIQNTGEAALNNVIVYDTLPSYISYIYGTTRLDDGAITSDSIISNGINIGSIYSGSSRIITFEASINYTGTSQSLTLTNRAYSHADQASEDNDTATIYVTQAANVSNLNISQSVRNSTIGQTSFSPSVIASAGDHIIFLVELTTPANATAITNVRVWDVLPAGLNYIIGSSRVDGSYANDGIISDGINLGAIYASQGHRINFEAAVNANYSGTQTLTNYAYVSGDSVYQRSASAQIIASPAGAASSALNKKVENLTSPNGTVSSNIASPGEILRYTLTFTNRDIDILNNIKIIDILPSYTIFQSADRNGIYENAKNQITWNLGSLLGRNNILAVSYQVKVTSDVPDNFVISNTASLSATDFYPINSNEVRTNIKLIKPRVYPVAAMSGTNSWANLALSLVITLWAVFALYLLIEYADFWRNLRLKLAILKARTKK